MVTRNLPPLVGGMERLMQHAAEGLSAESELTVIGPTGCGRELPEAVKVVEIDPRPSRFLPLALYHSIRLCRSRQPRIAIGGSGLMGPLLLILKWMFPVRTVVFLHGLDIVADHIVYQLVFAPCFRRLHMVIANSKNTADLAIEAGVSHERIEIIHPGTSLPDVIKSAEIADFRRHHGIESKYLLLFVGRVAPRKGLLGFVENCLPVLLAEEPDTCLAVVGEDPEQGLVAGASELRKIIELVDSRGIGRSLRFLGHIDDAELHRAYAAADALVFPLVPTPGDVEGFGMVAIEAAAAGTPTVAFAVGGVVDAVSEGESGILVGSGDYSAFTQALISIFRSENTWENSCRSFAANFAWPRYHEKLSRSVLGVQ